MTLTKDREKAWELLSAHNREEMHLRHALAVEGAMRHFARRAGEDEDLWGIVGLLHDLDWEETPDRHCAQAAIWLEEAGYPPEFVRAMQAHGWDITGVEPQSLLEKTLYTVDELTVRPTRSTGAGGVLAAQTRSTATRSLSSEARSWASRTCRRSRAIGADRCLRNREKMLMRPSVRRSCRRGHAFRQGW